MAELKNDCNRSKGGDFMGTKFLMIKKIAENSEGIITTKQIEEAGLSRTIIKNYIDQELLVRESQGIYTVSSAFVDEYKLLQKRSEKLIFSYGTALSLLQERILERLSLSKYKDNFVLKGGLIIASIIRNRSCDLNKSTHTNLICAKLFKNYPYTIDVGKI